MRRRAGAIPVVFGAIVTATVLYNVTGPHEVTIEDSTGHPVPVDALTPHGDTPRLPGLSATTPTPACEVAQRDVRERQRWVAEGIVRDDTVRVSDYGLDERFCPNPGDGGHR